MRFIKPFKGVKASEIYHTDFEPGDECPDELAAAAMLEGVVEVKAEEPKPMTKAEKKAAEAAAAAAKTEEKASEDTAADAKTEGKAAEDSAGAGT